MGRLAERHSLRKMILTFDIGIGIKRERFPFKQKQRDIIDQLPLVLSKERQFIFSKDLGLLYPALL